MRKLSGSALALVLTLAVMPAPASAVPNICVLCIDPGIAAQQGSSGMPSLSSI
jgi:hypothetical protein